MRETRKRNFTERLTEDEYRELCKMADRMNLSAGAYIRYTLFGGIDNGQNLVLYDAPCND